MAEVIVVISLIAAFLAAMSDEDRRALLRALRGLADDVNRRSLFSLKKATPSASVVLDGVGSPSIALDSAIPGALVEETATLLRETLDPIEAFNLLRLRRRTTVEEASATLTYALRMLLEEARCGTSSRHHCSRP